MKGKEAQGWVRTRRLLLTKMAFCDQECHGGGLAGDNVVMSRREGL